MHSQLPKVLHELAGRPLIQHVLAAATDLLPDRIHVVVGHCAADVRAALPEDERILCVEQAEQRGTGHAVLQALPGVDADARVLVLYGDVPLVQPTTLTATLEAARDGLAIVTAQPADPTGLGRIVRDQTGSIIAVVEERDASDAQRAISEINSGILAAPAGLLAELLARLGDANDQNEVYLTDVVAAAVDRDVAVAGLAAASELEVCGVNDRRQLATLEREFQRRLADELLLGGTSLMDPARIDIRGSLRAGTDCVIDVNVVFEGEVALGDRVAIGPNCLIKDALIGDGCRIEANTVIDGAVLEPGCRVGPFARLREDTVLAAGVKIGNFVETKKTRLGAGSKSNHFAYLGDTTTGADCNIGAGTIMCNYDGINKHRTTLGEGVFIGSNATLVAPVEIGDGGYVAAGSTVTTQVPSGQLAIGRARQRNIEGWTPPARRKPGG
jgi:bifunctional UDP-N-acetylglucosamine pyrophosphorylase/glucosamine-1-phosphate N-acetyltransferase